MNNFNGAPKLQPQVLKSSENKKEEQEKKREAVLTELNSSEDSLRSLEEILKKDGKNWHVISAVSEHAASRRKPNATPPENIEKRENLLLRNFQKFDPEVLTSLMTTGIDKHFDNRTQILILGSIPFEKLNISPEQKKRISAFAINLIQNNNLIFKEKDNGESPATLYAIRNMSKSGILDYTQFLSQNDSTLVFEKMKELYFEQNKKSIREYFFKEKKDDKDESGKTYYSKVILDEESKKEIKKFFKEDSFGVKFENELGWLLSSNQIGYSSFIIGKKDEDKGLRLCDCMTPMVLRNGAICPGHDLRLNLNFNSKNYEKISEMAASIIAYAQLHGVQIISKIALPDSFDGNEIHNGRILFYVDENVAKIIIDYMKKNKYIPDDMNFKISTDSKSKSKRAFLSKDDPNFPVILRGTGESDVSDWVPRLISKIVNSK